MAEKNVNDYLEEGIYGPKELKPDEKRRFLGTFRERVLLALTKKQVMQKGTFLEVEQMLQHHPDAVMVVNGKLGYKAVSAYTKLADSYGVESQRITSLNKETDIGLVLAKEEAVHKEDIFVEESVSTGGRGEDQRSWWKKLLGIK
ncbi:YueI family protein [Salibacterium halotolerans]|uniref:Uncharacterized protein YueI n=1 Tax=Salibacterium halotolerans TaxID=1884432 RepID=A0A1I5UWV7_9BACI|nr:YueI family protein [Salibacterium halotolerans]SFP99682.1 Uncharacterized protein YueI [Salibacterium halotolerans]